MTRHETPRRDPPLKLVIGRSSRMSPTLEAYLDQDDPETIKEMALARLQRHHLAAWEAYQAVEVAGEKPAVAAQRLGIAPAAMRQRLSRARRWVSCHTLTARPPVPDTETERDAERASPAAGRGLLAPLLCPHCGARGGLQIEQDGPELAVQCLLCARRADLTPDQARAAGIDPERVGSASFLWRRIEMRDADSFMAADAGSSSE